ncbi:hypothetical protein MTQ01_19540 [Streptomyces sp. XM4193]|uniref:hypothetical protein n=1 Tax=Streptomyces sp. XM4193 TaxID=2929782 RepID=UPI001FF9F79A|nr:hypothetical protein [Streptomyces sp. XM4193]MCK1798179.1 hypothetical protein [Streptomyces sp. XM4193]
MTSTSTPQSATRWRSERPEERRPDALLAGERKPSGSAADETVQQAAPTPIYAALARQWSAEHRTVPGDFDQEWTTLVDYATWRRRQPRLPRQ